MSDLLLRLAPFRGLDTRMAQHAPGEGTPMVGGFNVEVKDGEWWVRHGHEMAYREPAGTFPFFRVLRGHGFPLIVGPWAAVDFSLPATSERNIPYTADNVDDVTYVNGSDAATSANAVGQEGDLLLVDLPSIATSVYRITAVDGTDITLDRDFTATSGTYSTDFHRLLFDDAAQLGSRVSNSDGLTECVVMEQVVTHSSTTLGYANPAVTSGGRYLIITTAEGDGSPIAIALTVGAAPLRAWFRLTGKSAPSEIASAVKPARFCALFKGCLCIAGGDDPTGHSDEITLWFSRPGDFLLWHDGVQGSNYAHRFIVFDGDAEENPVHGMAPNGEELIVYRRKSLEVVYPSGGIFDYTSFPLDCIVFANSIVPVTGGHFLLTSRGPAFCDGRTVTPVAELRLRELLREYGVTDLREVTHGVLHDAVRSRIYWNLLTRHPLASTPASSASGVLVLDYGSGEVWLEDHVTWNGGGTVLGAGGSLVLVARADGSIAMLHQHTSGKDGAVEESGTDHVVDALAETPWLPLNGIATNAIVLLRALNSGTASDNDIDDLWSETSETLHLATLEFFTDYEMTARCTRACTILVSDMLALVSEGDRALPVIPFNVPLEEVAGRSVKVRVKNAGGAQGTSKGHFRLVDIQLFGTRKEDIVPRNARAGAAL